MFVEQLSIFMENRTGELARVTRFLASNGINLRALSVADTLNFGILRIIVEDPDKVSKILRDNDYMVKKTEVIAVEVPDIPGGLSKIAETLAGGGVGIEYIYAFQSVNAGKAFMIVRADDNDEAQKVLEKKGINTAGMIDIF